MSDFRMTLTSCITALAVAGLLPFTSSDARACGGFFTEVQSSEVAVLSDIRVVLVQKPGQVDQYVQVAYDGKVDRFAWVYPVAGNPEVREASDSPFEKLEEITRPRVTIQTIHDSGGGGFGCGSAMDGAARGPEQVDPTVQVWQRGQVGAFDYVVISATKVEDMLDWLNQNGFGVPAGAANVVGHYIGLGWFFVAMKVSVQHLGDGDIPSTTVIRLTYAANEVRYPLHMVSLSPSTKTSVELYLVSTEPEMELAPQAPFGAVPIDPEALTALSPSTHNYEQVFESTLQQQGSRGLVIEYSGTGWSPSEAHLDGVPAGAVLTRLRGVFDAAAMDQDLVFAHRSHSAVSSSFDLTYDPDRAAAAAPPALLLLLLGWRLWQRRRRG